MRDTLLNWRQDILKNLGGLPEPEVKNREWLYLLKRETRNSIMVEGIFVKEDDLEAILVNGNHEIKNAGDVLNYFRTAKFIYGLGFENFRNSEILLSLGFIRQVNKGIQEGKSMEPGILRKGKVIIDGAEIQPPEFDLENWLRFYTQWVKENVGDLPLLRFAALQHSFFEAIHPFVDGNGRTGRILTNYLFISQGFPIITVKGDDASRKLYYEALQEADANYNEFFRDSPDYDKLTSILASSITVKLEELFFRGLRENMDRLIVSLMEQRGEKMLSSEELAASLGYSRSSIRKLVERGKLISIKRRGTYISHPSLLHKGK